MRVLQVIDSLTPGGAERSLVTIAPHLLDRGVDVEVAVLHERDGLGPELTALGIPIHMAGGASRLASCRRIASLVRAVGPDLVHTTLFESDVAGRIAAARRRVPVVSSFASTSYGPEHLAQPGIRRHRLRAAQALDAATARLVRRFHAVSGVVADAMAGRLRLPRDRIDVVWRGRDPTALGTRTVERRAAARDMLGLDDDVPLLVMLGRHETDKGIDIAISATAKLRSSVPDLRLVVAGQTGRATAALREQIAGDRLDGAVSLLGPRHDVAELLCAADVFLAPSRREGLPGAVLEAMALQVPIVASDLPAVLEALGPDDTAALVPVGDVDALASAVARSLGDSAGSAARAIRGRERFLACFTIERAAEGMHAFYARALGEAI